MEDPEFREQHERRRREFREAKKPASVTTDRDKLIKKIGVRYADCSIDNFRPQNDEQRAAVSKLSAYLGDLRNNVQAGRSLIFYGPCGTGKDHLMTAAMFELIDHGVYPMWVNGLDWYGRVREDIEQTEELIKRLVEPIVLAISDPIPPAVSSGKADGELSAWRIELLQRVVDLRYRNLRPVWMTINVTGINQLRERLSIPLADRLLHEAVGIQLNGETERRPRGAK